MSNLVALQAYAKATSQPELLGPVNIECEQAALGGMLVNNDAIAHVIDFLKPEHFSEELHKRIFDVIVQLHQSGKVASPVTLRTFLGDHDLGGVTIPQYLARLAGEATTILNVPDYARTIVDLAVRREIIAAADELRRQAVNASISASPAVIAEEAISRLHEIGMTGAIADTKRSPGVSAAALLDRARRIMAGEEADDGVPTGLPDLDRLTGGFRPGKFWLIAGRPGHGKTVLATGLAWRTAKGGLRRQSNGGEGYGAMLIEHELDEQETMARILADMAYRARKPIQYNRIVRGELDDEDLWSLSDAQKRLAEMPLAIDVASSLSVPQIALRVRAEKSRMAKKGFRLGVVFIDYLKYVRDSGRYGSNMTYAIGEKTAALHELAKDEGLCVVGLSQLNRALEDRGVKDKRPNLADLRGSGDLEADADVVAFIHREAYYIERSPEYRKGDPAATDLFLASEHQAELIIAKSRMSGAKTVDLQCDIGCSTFAPQARGGAA